MGILLRLGFTLVRRPPRVPEPHDRLETSSQLQVSLCVHGSTSADRGHPVVNGQHPLRPQQTGEHCTWATVLGIARSAINCGMCPLGRLVVAMRHSILPSPSSLISSTLEYCPRTPFSSSPKRPGSGERSTGIETIILQQLVSEKIDQDKDKAYPSRGELWLSSVT